MFGSLQAGRRSVSRRILLGATLSLGFSAAAGFGFSAPAQANAAHPKIGFSIDDLRLERWAHDRDYFVAAATKLGAVGFCMGGGMAIGAAATYPQRFAAVASFHGGNLATDAPTSPHLLVPDLAARVYIASAENDGSYPPSMAARLEDSLSNADVRYRAETYQGASHGWMVPDFPVYDNAAADRGWNAMLALFSETLRV